GGEKPKCWEKKGFFVKGFMIPSFSVGRKAEKKKKELKPYKIKVLALFFYKKEKALYILLPFLPHCLSTTSSFSWYIGD
ncbi:hypothetical protein ACQ1Z4_14620, partial [Enterococcus faecalis]|uniref:hypothetical protein n=1 Tax=Enterococcus faecalis TaxID=1351 RepID=UPI003D6C47F7